MYTKFLQRIPITRTDKRMRIKDPNALRYKSTSYPIPSLRKETSNLTFLFRLLIASGVETNETVSFRGLLDPPKIQTLISVLEKRQISPGRIYTLTLTLLKALNFVADFCMLNHFPLSVTHLKTWTLVRNVAQMSKMSEKQRVVSKKLSGSSPKQMLSKEEMTTLLKICQTWLEEKASPPPKISGTLRRDYLAHFIVALFLSVPPPRVQVLRKLVFNQTFFFDGSLYYFRFDGLNPPLKSKKPLLLFIPEHLTKPLQIWLNCYRPPCESEAKDIIFPNPRGVGARRDWSTLTNAITKKYLKKSISPRVFRYYEMSILIPH